MIIQWIKNKKIFFMFKIKPIDIKKFIFIGFIFCYILNIKVA